MDHSLISVRYAKALFSLSKDKGISDKVYADMTLLNKQFSSVKELRQFLGSPVIPSQRKKQLFTEVLSSQVDQLTMKFLSMLVDNGREAMLQNIAVDFTDFYKKEKGIKSVSLYTALKLDEDYVSNIKQVLEKELNAPIQLNVFEREHLIGGFMLMLDGKLIDTSVAAKLQQIKKQLLS